MCVWVAKAQGREAEESEKVCVWRVLLPAQERRQERVCVCGMFYHAERRRERACVCVDHDYERTERERGRARREEPVRVLFQQSGGLAAAIENTRGRG